jgi:hypothetical protein
MNEIYNPSICANCDKTAQVITLTFFGDNQCTIVQCTCGYYSVILPEPLEAVKSAEDRGTHNRFIMIAYGNTKKSSIIIPRIVIPHN